jgi:hypothetical protein
LIGIFSEKFTNIRSNYIGSDDYSNSFYCYNGNKYTKSNSIIYGTKCENGDKIDLILDLTTSYGTMEFKRNGKTFGIAYSGIKYLGNLYFGLSFYDPGDTISVAYEKISD